MPKIAERLTRQLRGKGVKKPKEMAYKLLNKMGHMKGSELTAKGRERNSMTPAERAKDRQAKYSGNSPKDYTYNKKTNRARLK